MYAAWITVYRTVFNFNLWKSAKGFISGLGKPSFHCILHFKSTYS